VKQTLSHFVLVQGGQVVKEAPPPAAVTEGLILPPEVKQVPGRLFVIFIDDMHIQPEDSIKARRILEKIKDVLLRDDDLVTIVSTGYSSIQVQLGRDPSHRRFDEAIGKLLGSAMTPAEIISAAQTSQGPAGLRHNAHIAFKTAYDLLEQLGKIQNRRKAFVYMSSGYDFNPFVQARFQAIQDMYAKGQDGGRNPFETGGQQFSDADLIAEVAALTRAAQRATVTCYTLDPRGLVAGPGINTNLSPQAFQAYIDTSVSTLKVLGDQTGGFCICNTNDFTKGLQKIDDAMSDYYVIGYTSSNSNRMQRRRTITVNITRTGVTASGYRREYYVNR
jgi:VWFA-related protein